MLVLKLRVDGHYSPRVQHNIRLDSGWDMKSQRDAEVKGKHPLCGTGPPTLEPHVLLAQAHAVGTRQGPPFYWGH